MDVSFIQTYGSDATVMIDYRVAGFAYGNADKNAPLVDKLLAAQAQRYADYVRSRSKVTKAKAGRPPSSG